MAQQQQQQQHVWAEQGLFCSTKHDIGLGIKFGEQWGLLKWQLTLPHYLSHKQEQKSTNKESIMGSPIDDELRLSFGSMGLVAVKWGHKLITDHILPWTIYVDDSTDAIFINNK